MSNESGNETELFRYLNVLRNRIGPSRQARLTNAGEEGGESGHIFRAIFENAADGILVVDVESKRFYLANRVLCHMLGYSQRELRMLEVGDIHPEADLPYVTQQFEKQVKEELTLARNIPVKRKDGSVFYADINSFPITFGRKTYLMGIFRDITRHKNAEEKLRQSEQKWRSLTENAPDVILMADLDGTILFANHAVFPLVREAVIGTSLYEYIPPEHQITMRKAIEHVVCTGQSCLYQLAGSGPGGQLAWYQSHVGPVKRDDQILGVTIIARDVTEQKAMEDELRKFKTVADEAGYGISMSDLEGCLIYVNRLFAQMHGYKAEELIGKNLCIFHSEEQFEEVDRLNQQLREKGSYISEEVGHTRRDGTTFCALMNGTLIKDEHGEPQFMAATTVDITNRKIIETALAESEEKYRTLVESSSDAICILDRCGAFLFANRKAADVMGIQREELIGKTMWDFFPKDVADRRIAAVRQVIENKQDMSIVRQTELRNQLFWYHTKLLPIGDGRGGTVVMSISRDVGDIKHAEERIRTLSSAVEQSMDGIAISDLERRLSYVNGAYASMHGYTPEEMVGMRFSDVQNSQKMDAFQEIVHYIEVHGSWAGKTEHSRKDGTVFPCYISITSLKDDQGQTTGRIAVCRDITQSQKREQELATYREHMARAEQLASLGTLSATIAHQITQPLTVIRLSLDNVVDELEGTSCSSTVLRRLRDSVTQVSNITSIINQFRSYARQSSDTVFGEVNVHAVVVRIARLLDGSARQVRVTLHVDDMSHLPPVLLHERKFEQILFALLENAIQASDGKKNRRIVISGSVKEGRIELRFSDNCGGIPPENLDKIFEPFFTTKPRGLGTGLGLCIVKDAVARIGGRVRVESQYGKGSTFFLTLPMSED